MNDGNKPEKYVEDKSTYKIPKQNETVDSSLPQRVIETASIQYIN